MAEAPRLPATPEEAYISQWPEPLGARDTLAELRLAPDPLFQRHIDEYHIQRRLPAHDIAPWVEIVRQAYGLDPRVGYRLDDIAASLGVTFASNEFQRYVAQITAVKAAGRFTHEFMRYFDPSTFSDAEKLLLVQEAMVEMAAHPPSPAIFQAPTHNAEEDDAFSDPEMAFETHAAEVRRSDNTVDPEEVRGYLPRHITEMSHARVDTLWGSWLATADRILYQTAWGRDLHMHHHPELTHAQLRNILAYAMRVVTGRSAPYSGVRVNDALSLNEIRPFKTRILRVIETMFHDETHNSARHDPAIPRSIPGVTAPIRQRRVAPGPFFARRGGRGVNAPRIRRHRTIQYHGPAHIRRSVRDARRIALSQQIDEPNNTDSD